MSELILRGFDLFLDKTHSAGRLSISPEITETVFLVLGFLLVFAGVKLYRLVISLVMFIGATLLFCTLLDGRAGWGTIVTAFTILGCLLGFMAFSWKTADSILFAGMAVASVPAGTACFRRSRRGGCRIFPSGGSSPGRYGSRRNPSLGSRSELRCTICSLRISASGTSF